MTDNMREKLIELQKEAVRNCEPGSECLNCRYMGQADCMERLTADYMVANGVTVQDDVAKLEKAMERLGRFGRLFVDYRGCPRGAIGRMGWPGDGILPDRVEILLREIQLMDAVVDVDGNRWVPVLEAPLNDLIRMAQNASVQGWIPVSKRLPDTIPCGAGTAYSEAVNVLTSGRKVLTAIWNGTDFIADAEFWEAEGEEITHWTPVLLPLPQPPAGDAEQERPKATGCPQDGFGAHIARRFGSEV